MFKWFWTIFSLGASVDTWLVMLVAWLANSCNLMIALMQKKEANINWADVNGDLSDCDGAILTTVGS